MGRASPAFAFVRVSDMNLVAIDTNHIRDWDFFNDVFVEAFGFPFGEFEGLEGAFAGRERLERGLLGAFFEPRAADRAAGRAVRGDSQSAIGCRVRRICGQPGDRGIGRSIELNQAP